MKYVYDESVEITTGLFECPECGCRFHGGGQALHNPGRTAEEYEGVEFHFGPSQVVEAVQRGLSLGADDGWYGVSFSILREKFPELVEGVL